MINCITRNLTVEKSILFFMAVLFATVLPFIYLVLDLPRAIAGHSVFPKGVTIYNESQTYNGYTFVKDGVNNKLDLIDMRGEVVHSWRSPSWCAFPNIGFAKPPPSGNTLFVEARWGRVLEVTENGEIVWEYINSHYINKEERDYSNWQSRAYRVDDIWLTGGPSGPVEPFPW